MAALRSVQQALHGAWAPALEHLASRKHEAAVFLVSGAAWALLLARHAGSEWAPLCVSPPAAGLQGIEEAIGAVSRLGIAREAMASWALMCLAMVPVLALPMVRFVAARSFAQRRALATVEFLAGSFLVWLFAGAVLLLPALLIAAQPDLSHPLVASAAFAFAALWQLTPARRLALQRCHRTTALAAAGWGADRDCLGFGIAAALPCVVTCWALMLACALAFHAPAALLVAQGIAMHERAVQSPHPWRYALILMACALAALARFGLA